MLRQSYNVDIGYIYRYLRLSVLWLHIFFSPVIRVDRALCTLDSAQSTQWLCEPKHVGATIIILNDFNILTVL